MTKHNQKYVYVLAGEMGLLLNVCFTINKYYILLSSIDDFICIYLREYK